MIKLSIDRPTLVVVLFAMLTILGVLSLTSLNIELLPKFSAPVLTVTTIFPGASPAEVENGLTKKIEDAVSTLENIRAIRSASIENFSIVTVQLDFKANTDDAIQDAQRKIDAIAGQLPPDARPPTISKISSDDFPIMNIGATSTLSGVDFYQLMEDRVQPALARLKGVGQISLLGGQEREIRVSVNLNKLEQYRISILQVLQAIRLANLEFPTGKIQNDEEQVLIRLAGKFQSIDQIRELIIFTNPLTGAPVKLSEVAEVSDTQKEVSDLSRVNGRSSISISILKTSDANAVEVSKLVEAALTSLEEQFQEEDLQFAIATNTTDFTIEAVNAVTQDLILAIILVAAVMLLFLHSLRNALIVMISIPASLVTTFIVMNALGYTINVLTLLAMSLVIGILVDDSIVVLENIFRHLEMGKKSKLAALDGAREIFWTAMSITLVLVVVFIPLILSSGIVNIIMGQFAVVVTVSILMSLIVSYTIAPAMAARLSRLEQLRPGSFADLVFGNFERWIRRLGQAYGRSLEWALDHKLFIVVLTVALLAGSVLLVTEGYVGTAFLNTGDRGEFIIQLELAKDATLPESNRAARQVEEYLFGQEAVTGVFTLVGRQTGFLSGGRIAPNLAELSVKLVDKQNREVSTAIYAAQTKKALAGMLPGVKIKANESSFFGSANDTPIQVIVSSADYEEAQRYAVRVLEQVKKTEGTIEAELSTGEGAPQVSVEVDRTRMAELGLNLQIVGGTLQVAFNGNTDAKYREGGNEYDINIQLDAFDRRSTEDIANLTFLNQKGQLLKLSQFATIRPTIGPAVLQRQDRVSAVTVLAGVLGRPSGTIGAELQEWIDNTPPPPGVDVSFGGDLERQAESFASLGLAFLASILFVYLILVALYDSFLYPLVVMFSIPVALVGALLALALVMESLNVFSLVGIIMLNGLVAKNAILLVDFANQAKDEGLPTREALIQAGRIRLRPILMTAISLIVGMIPIALASGAAAEWKNGLAWVIIGGLTSSTLLTLFLVPVIYQLADKVKGWAGRI